METDLSLAGRILGPIEHVDLSVPDDRCGVERSELLPPDDAIAQGREEGGSRIWRDDRIDLSRLFERAEHPLRPLRIGGFAQRSEKDETKKSRAFAQLAPQ